jgi:hypothetical protein
MAQTTTLDVVNACLKTMGETPLNAVDTDHPYVQAALNVLQDSNKLEQEVGWWFNSDFPTLQPDGNTGFVYVPADALNVELAPENVQLVQRGNRLYDTYNNTYVIGREVLTRVIREIPFEDLPENVKLMVSLRTQLDFQSSYDADDAKYQKIYASYGQAYNRVRRMHIRNMKTNAFNTPHASYSLSRIRPSGRYPLGRLPPYGR